MKTIVLTLIIAFIIIAGSILIYISSGAYDISQLSQHNSLTKWMIKTTTHNSINKRIKDIQAPPMNDSDAIVIGFLHYNEMCVACHGAPGVKPWEMAEGLYPKPPEFAKSKHLPESAEAFWIIKDGIKMTSMPAYAPTHDDKKIWAITDFLVNKLNKMSPDEYKAWQQKYAEGEDEDDDAKTDKD
jgi:mono/diheme cytochrome c family protein